MTTQMIHLIGFASGIAANNPGCGKGPLHMQNSTCLQTLNISWQDLLQVRENKQGLDALPAIADIDTRLAEHISSLVQKQQAFAVIGGDHSSAVGTWSGVYSAIQSKGELGLIWIDAHMDSHTPETTPSGNIHGMPLAALLGYGPQALCYILEKKPKIKPQNVCLIGVRSYESGEYELLKRLGVRIFFMDEIKQQGMEKVMQNAITLATQNTAGFGLSIDLDAMDPEDAPGVGCPESDGIKAAEFCKSLRQLRKQPSLLGLEIAEFNPNLDQQQKTEHLICEILETVWE